MTTDKRPDPPVPPDLDLRGLKWMPLLGARLFESDFYLRADPLEFRTALLLWWKSWNQVPASSLPNDDTMLAKLAGFGEAPAKWNKLRTIVLDGFTECKDGRLYHRVVAEQALLAGDWHEQHTAKVANHAERKRRERAARKQLFADLRAVGVVPDFDTGTAKLRELVALHCTRDDDTRESVTSHSDTVTGGTAKTGRDGTGHSNSGGAGGPQPPPAPAPAREDVGDAGKPEPPPPPPPPPPAPPVPTPAPPPRMRGDDAPPPDLPPAPDAPAEPDGAPTLRGLACLAIKRGGIVDVNPGHPDLQRLIDAGVSDDTFEATARELTDRKKPRFALLLSTLAGRLRDAAASSPLPPAPPGGLNGNGDHPGGWQERQERRGQRMAAALAPLKRNRAAAKPRPDDDEGTLDGLTRIVPGG